MGVAIVIDMQADVAAQLNPFVFVVGCPRSGTTLLQRILDHHPMLAVANDTHFITRCLEKCSPHAAVVAEAGGTIPLTSRLSAAIRSYHRFHRLGVTEAQAARMSVGVETYTAYVRALYTQFAAQHGKPLGGEKTPDYVRRLPLLRGLFPWARFVHIFRDGRDVALSTLDWATGSKGPGKLELWATEPVATCALWWEWQVSAGRRQGGRFGPRTYLELRYEDLVLDPGGQAFRLTDFLGLDYDARMVNYHQGKVRIAAGGSAKSRWLPPTAGLRDWRTQMPERDVALFEALAGDMLTEFGYERAVPRVPAAVVRTAERSRAWWQALMERRTRKLRRGWGQR